MTERAHLPDVPDFSDPPFACPPDTVLDLPPTVSVNRSRRIDWKGHRKVQEWVRIADQFLLVAKAAKQARCDRLPRYEIQITLSEHHVKTDADNALKLIIDYLRHRDITADDGPQQMRKITVVWGHAPAGVRVKVMPCE